MRKGERGGQRRIKDEDMNMKRSEEGGRGEEQKWTEDEDTKMQKEERKRKNRRATKAKDEAGKIKKWRTNYSMKKTRQKRT